MADVFTREKRSEIMSRIRGRDTSPEKSLARILRRLGLKFRRHVRTLPGNPDFILPDRKVAIFVNGCFWHGHRGCKKATIPTSNRTFWCRKLTGNAARDRKNGIALRKRGWRRIVVWQCQLKDEANVSGKVRRVLEATRET
ncbi:MAG: DNA mismatch endonuclease Vsr [Nitrospirae bacterium]|nr:DNA mismatch endonuclease Vsr [Nitrospirota bacterium]